MPRQSERQPERQSTTAVVGIKEEFSGPLPTPAILEQYERTSPGSADRIMKMAESEVTHRHQLENTVVRGDIFEARMGQIFAFLIGIFAIGCGTYAAVNGAEIAGSLVGAGGVIGLVSAFIYGRRKQ